MKPVLGLTLLALVAVAVPAHADEGMWTFDNFPKQQVKQKYGFAPTDAWLHKVMHASARIAEGCSASFVSGRGLVMTNHHCAHSCLAHLSSASTDYVARGFYARRLRDEKRCPAMEIDQLVEITDVTKKMNAATKGLAGAAFHAAERAERARLAKACQTSAAWRCQVVGLYHGGIYDLYKYRRFQDVRLVFAPEKAIAFFGGDPDNFEYPRYDLDVSFLRVYDHGKPAKTPDHFRWSKTGPKAGELTFVSGNPGHTDRELTVAQLRYRREVSLPSALLFLSKMDGLLTEFATKGKEEARTAETPLFFVQNAVKNLRGQWRALNTPKVWQEKEAAEAALKAKVARDPKLAASTKGAWDAIAGAMDQARKIHLRYELLEGGMAFRSHLFGIARTLVRAGTELKKPNGKRLPMFSDAALPLVKARLFSPVPIHKKLEVMELTFGLTTLRAELGADDPVVREVLGKRSPRQLAEYLVGHSRLGSVAVRQALWKGGAKAIAASKDPMIRLAALVDPAARQIRKTYEDEVEAVVRPNMEKIAKARFAIYGTRHYPDATFTPRLSYGQVKGYMQRGERVKPFTDFAGAFARATGQAPFALPASWHQAKARLDLKTPFDFVTDNDVVGGNSGSPVIDKDLNVVGLIFDGNIQSLGGDYYFDEAVNRSVAVDTAALTEALGKVYRAHRLLEELTGTAKATATR